MTPSELRIGNYVDYIGISKVLELHSEQKQFDNVYLECEESFEWTEYSKLKPIPLTEEILLKCGFEITGQTEQPNNIWTYYGEECKFELEHITSFFLHDNKCFGTEIKHLHQLQNIIFVLTGKELKINL